MKNTTSIITRHQSLIASTGLLAAAAIMLVALAGWQTNAAGIVVVRGIVKSGGDTDSINLYITNVDSAPDPSRIRGIKTDVDTGSAKKYTWKVTKGVLSKVATKSNPVPEQEVVVRGTLQDDDRIVAAWIVQNYRKFSIEGTLEGVTLDTGSIDAGYLTINVTSSKLLDVKPAKGFKEAYLKGKEIRIRVDGTTAITSLGKSKHLDEVSVKQQKVRIEGQLLDEDTWSASKVNEL